MRSRAGVALACISSPSSPPNRAICGGSGTWSPVVLPSGLYFLQMHLLSCRCIFGTNTRVHSGLAPENATTFLQVSVSAAINSKNTANAGIIVPPTSARRARSTGSASVRLICLFSSSTIRVGHAARRSRTTRPRLVAGDKLAERRHSGQSLRTVRSINNLLVSIG